MPGMFSQPCMTSQHPSSSAVDSGATSTNCCWNCFGTLQRFPLKTWKWQLKTKQHNKETFWTLGFFYCWLVTCIWNISAVTIRKWSNWAGCGGVSSSSSSAFLWSNILEQKQIYLMQQTCKKSQFDGNSFESPLNNLFRKWVKKDSQVMHQWGLQREKY